jgi:hydrogenase expression/formation protein HypC
MCLAIPVRVISINGTDAEVEIGGITRQTSLMLTPEAKVGDYVLLHAGYAINIIDRKEAEETLAIFAEMSQVMEQE